MRFFCVKIRTVDYTLSITHNRMEQTAETHVKLLDKHCRVCAGRLQRAKSRSTSFLCTSHKEDLRSAFNIDIEKDDVEEHPTHFCNSCYKKMKRSCANRDASVPQTSTLQVFHWTSHTTEECPVSLLYAHENKLFITQ